MKGSRFSEQQIIRVLREHDAGKESRELGHRAHRLASRAGRRGSDNPLARC